MAVCFDTGKSFRYGLFKDYKANRHKGVEVTYDDAEAGAPSGEASDYFDELVSTLQMLNIPVVVKPTLEADDLLATIGFQAPRSVLVSKDKDQLQGITANCSILQPGVQGNPDVLVDLQSFKAGWNMTPAQFLDVQTLMGDKTDNIPQLVTPAVAKKRILKYGSIKGWLASGEEPPDQTLLDALKLNRKLVRMLTDCFEFDMALFKIPKAPKKPTKISKYMELVNSVGKKSLFG